MKPQQLKVIESKVGNVPMVVNMEDSSFATKVMWARKEKDPWEEGGTIELLAQEWARRYPEEVQDILYNVKLDKSNLQDKKFGQTQGGKEHERRYIAVMPLFLQSTIRAMYTNEELPFDRRFWNKFRKKFPKLAISERT